MKRTVATVLAAALLCWPVSAEDAPAPPTPEKEHVWLQQLAGEWDSEAEIPAGEGQPPMKVTGTESARMLGGFWLHSETRSEMMGTPFVGVMTVGFDPATRKYVGTWVDSTTSRLWRYEGSVDGTGRILTLNSEGPHPSDPAKTAKYREVIEIQDKDHKTFTSQIEIDGKWERIIRVSYTRKT